MVPTAVRPMDTEPLANALVRPHKIDVSDFHSDFSQSDDCTNAFEVLETLPNPLPMMVSVVLPNRISLPIFLEDTCAPSYVNDIERELTRPWIVNVTYSVAAFHCCSPVEASAEKLVSLCQFVASADEAVMRAVPLSENVANPTPTTDTLTAPVAGALAFAAIV